MRLVQDTAHYLEHTGQGGLLLLADQKSAYPRTQWGFLQKVMARMHVHPDFCAMVASLYQDPAVHILDVRYVSIVSGREADTMYLQCIWTRYSGFIYALYLSVSGPRLDTLYLQCICSLSACI